MRERGGEQRENLIRNKARVGFAELSRNPECLCEVCLEREIMTGKGREGIDKQGRKGKGN